ncbi:hypothetical protein [Streptomyces sp. NPDC048659]|uniref:hypothetical protein n=1 Tax=Streptomyces sp. NPDC048659 TaxID=3155489 RepID=UPI003412A7DA
MAEPTVGRIVHYTFDGTCMAALITAVTEDATSMTFFGPEGGQASYPDVPFSDTAPHPNASWHWPEVA